VKNYITIIKKWELEIDLSKYNFYLMPLAYVEAQVEAESILTSEMKNYFNFIQTKIKNQDDTDKDFDIAITIDIEFKKGNSFGDFIGMKYDPEGIPIILSEENIREKFPLTYSDILTKCKEKYSDFCQNKRFNKIMQDIKINEKLHHTRRLDTSNKNSQKKDFYSTNIFQVLDEHYTTKKLKIQDIQSNLFEN
jgi:hypothetical protein